jgi:hypothetical protein
MDFDTFLATYLTAMIMYILYQFVLLCRIISRV